MSNRVGLLAVVLFAFVLVFALSSCGGDIKGTTGPTGTEPTSLGLELLPGGPYSLPVMVTSPPGDSRLFIVEKTGAIRIIKNGALLPTPFLDVSSMLTLEYEQGLLSLAFDPLYASNGRFYVMMTTPGGIPQEQLMRFDVSSNPDVAMPGGTLLLSFDHPDVHHNAGMLEFGPDGMLYVSVGDGGEDLDVNGHAQSPDDLFGSILRLDVRTGNLVIPPDNPYTATGNRREVWNIGLRNPWRFSIDRGTGDMYIGDVGESSHEEIDVARATTQRGRAFNYGWNVLEGDACLDTSSCNFSGKVLPALEYSHGTECCVIGGYVYRGSAMPGLKGRYFYADYCARWVRSFRLGGAGVTAEKEWPGLSPDAEILSFGEDAAGELYLCTQNGKVYKIVPGPAPTAARTSSAAVR